MRQLIFLYLLLLSYFSVNAQFSERKSKYYTPLELLDKLNSYRSIKVEPVNYFAISKSESITDSVKERILSLLDRKWTSEEINPIINYHSKDFRDLFEARFWNGGLKDSISLYAMERRWYYDTTYHHFFDSLNLKYKKDIENKMLENQVPNEIVLSAAFAQIREAIPILKKDLLSNGNSYFNKDIAELALAKLDDEVFLKKIFAKHKQYVSDSLNFKIRGVQQADIFNMRILFSQESIAALADWIDTTYKIALPIHGNHPIEYAYASYEIINPLVRIIKNEDFFEGLKKISNDEYFNNGEFQYATAKHLMYIKNWMKKNKGKYQLNNK